MRHIRCGVLLCVVLVSTLCVLGQTTPSSSKAEQRQPATTENSAEPSAPTDASAEGRFKDPRLWALIGIVGVACFGATVLLLLRKLSAIRTDFDAELQDLRSRINTNNLSGERMGSVQLQSLEKEHRQLGNAVESLSGEVRQQKQDVARARSEYQRAVNDQGQEIGDIQNALRDHGAHAKAVETRIGALERRTLDTYFDDWKALKLRDRLLADGDKVLAQFSSSADVQSVIAESRSVLEKIAEKASSWFAAVAACNQELQSQIGPLGNENWRTFPDRLSEYLNRGQRFVSDLKSALGLADLSTVQKDTTENIDFFDVATGRVSRSQAEYLERLSSRVRELQQIATTAPDTWAKLREELLQVLDHFYGQFDASAGEPRSSLAMLDSKIRDALKTAKIQEIQIESSHTGYDPTLHEPLAGAKLTRPDLPDNTVVRLERRGFFYEGKVLRRALVTLSTRGN